MSGRVVSMTLKRLSLFQDLDARELELLAAVMRERRVDADTVIFREGEPGSSCFFVVEGSIEVRKKVGRRHERTLATLRPGQMFGHIALVDAWPRSATCIASESSRLLELERQDFDTLFHSGSRFAFKFQELIARVVAAQLRDANHKLNLLATASRATPTDVEMEEVQELLGFTDASEEWARMQGRESAGT